MMQLQTFTKIIDELHEVLIYLILYFQGEPFLNPSFFDAIRYAHSKKIYTATSTNAHFLDEQSAQKTVQSGLDRSYVGQVECGERNISLRNIVKIGQCA